MYAQVILYGCYGFIIWLLWKDISWRKAGSRVLLIPAAWLTIQGSRPLPYWFGDTVSGDSNPINTLSFAAFAVVSVLVLSHRGLNWVEFVAKNKALFIIYAYLLCSALWSESPGVTTKRLIKDFETVLVGLILLSQVDAAAAIRAIYMRVSYILFPLSVVYIKYFPDIGRSQARTGENMFTGVTTQKNSLGLMVLVFSIIILWDWIQIYKTKAGKGRKLQLWIRAGMIFMGLWLLKTCNSQTSFVCLVLGGLVFWGCGILIKVQQGKQMLIAGLASVVLLWGLDGMFGISKAVITAMGRDASLTGRTEIWELVLDQQQNSFFGFGFYTFWDSEQGREVMREFMRINNAHNGFLEMYLDGGLVGCALLGALLLAIGVRVINRWFDGHALGRVGLVIWLLAIVYNYSETSFFRLDVLWFTLLLLAMECPRVSRSSEQNPVRSPITEPELHGHVRYSH